MIFERLSFYRETAKASHRCLLCPEMIRRGDEYLLFQMAGALPARAHLECAGRFAAAMQQECGTTKRRGGNKKPETRNSKLKTQ